MTSLDARRADLQLQAEHTFVQLEAAVGELERRRRRTLRIAHLITPLTVLVLSGIFIKWLSRRGRARGASIQAFGVPKRPARMDPVMALLVGSALRAWIQRRLVGRPMLSPRQLGPGRLS